MLKLQLKFDLNKDVVSDILTKEASACRAATVLFTECIGALDTRILNIEQDGSILYSWKGATGTTRIGKFDSKRNTTRYGLLYTFDKEVHVSSCSLNKEETLLAVSLARNTREEERLKPISKCLTLLIEIHPINNTKVLKAVDCRVRVQFLYPQTDRRSILESHLLLLTDDGYVDHYHVLLTKQEGYRVVMVNPDRLTKAVERVVEDFSWVQWDGHAQRLYYLTHRDKYLLRCVQFYPNHNCETMMELSIELPANLFKTVKFVNLGFDHYHTERPEQEHVRMEVFTNSIGTMCVCWSQTLGNKEEVTYTVVLVHRGCSKKFRVGLDAEQLPENVTWHLPLFIPIGYYVLVYLAGCFLHCINTRQQEMLCHSLFLSGCDVDLGLQCRSADVTVLSENESSPSLLDLSSGKVYSADFSASFLLRILRTDAPSRCVSGEADRRRMAALHCLLVCMGNEPKLELKVTEWLCDNVNAFASFDQIQEFILASLYRISREKSLSLDKVLPYSSVFDMKEVPACLLQVPGVFCTTELHPEPVFKGKAQSLQGFWSELQWNTERPKYLEAVPSPRYTSSHISAHWDKLRSGGGTSDQLNHMENTKKVLSMVDTWCLDKKLVPLFQEEDHQQRALIGLTVDKLREHLNRHLPRLGKKKIDSLVVNYVAKLLELIRHILDSVWLKYELGPRVLCLSQQGSPAEWSVLHFMFRILEATRALCLPLPPGYHTLLAVFAVRCLPHHTFLQYIDHGLLQLTETFVSRLATDLDNSDANEKLKFSVLKRLPQPMEKTIFRMWDHPVSSASISRDYVRTLLEKRNKNKGFVFCSGDQPGFRLEFLPLTHLTKALSDIEKQALNPFTEQENVDAKFVEETALKQTWILLGFEEK
ncbi:gamma-secretase-activating protein [Thalassophryne amazonica]|uniref:gamma-secretase-activating protein n=1 Tax=Thalassophryne amazonica TaxID=390379 RepID=UPI001471BDB4|nr:gamma-secretase-activating protein [Thalassophryne amazonica]